jgi:hypothetical protein
MSATTVDEIHVGANKRVALRRVVVVREKGVEVSRTYERAVLEPGQDVSWLSVDAQQLILAAWA